MTSPIPTARLQEQLSAYEGAAVHRISRRDRVGRGVVDEEVCAVRRTGAKCDDVIGRNFQDHLVSFRMICDSIRIQAKRNPALFSLLNFTLFQPVYVNLRLLSVYTTSIHFFPLHLPSS